MSNWVGIPNKIYHIKKTWIEWESERERILNFNWINNQISIDFTFFCSWRCFYYLRHEINFAQENNLIGLLNNCRFVCMCEHFSSACRGRPPTRADSDSFMHFYELAHNECAKNNSRHCFMSVASIAPAPVINNCAIANWIEINLKHLMTHSCDDNGAWKSTKWIYFFSCRTKNDFSATVNDSSLSSSRAVFRRFKNKSLCMGEWRMKK